MEFVRTYTTTLSAPSGTGLGADITSVPSSGIESLVVDNPDALSPEGLGLAIFGSESHVAAATFESVELDIVRSLLSVALIRGEQQAELSAFTELEQFVEEGAALFSAGHTAERALVDFVLVAPVIVVEQSWPRPTHLGALLLAETGATLGIAVAALLTPIAFFATTSGMVSVAVGGHVRQRMRHRQLQAELDELDRLRHLDRLTVDAHDDAKKDVLDRWLRSGG